MRTSNRVHDKRLQNYTIGASLLGIRIPKSNIACVRHTVSEIGRLGLCGFEDGT